MTTLNTAQVTANTDSAATGTKENFHFKAIKVSAEKYTAERASFESNDVQFTENRDDKGQLVSIIRKNESHMLPVISIDELLDASPKFVADIIHGLVVTAARKNFVDVMSKETDLANLITAKMVIEANTKTVKTAISAETVTSFVKHITDIMTAKSVKAGTINIVTTLVKGKFNSQVLNRHIKHEAAFAPILESVVGYLAATDEAGEMLLSEDDLDLYMPLADLLAANLKRFVDEAQTEDEELNLGDL